jgi:hypothetical protein
MFTSDTLNANGYFKLILTTQSGTQPEGLTFPSVPGLYQVSFNVDPVSSTSFIIYNQMYIEVYGTAFSTLSITAMSTIPGSENVIWFKITPSTQILATQQIVVEFPTKDNSASGLVLFTNDLGYGLTDGNVIKTDIIGGDFNNGFMTCQLFNGDSTHSKSAKIVCGQFTSSISTSQLLFFAIKIINPSINGGRSQVSIPLFVYSNEQGTNYKTNFNVYDNAVYLQSYYVDYTNPGSISASNNMQTSGTTIDMITRNYQQLNAGDYYVLVFGFPLRNNGLVSNGCSWPGGTAYGDAYYHYNLWVIVCAVTNAANPISNYFAGVTYGYGSGYPYNNTRNLRISGFYTPWYYLSSAEQRVMTYSYTFGSYTNRALLNDLFPNGSPKLASTPTFTMAAVH